MPKPALTHREGVCCQYCAYFETEDCPVKDASPWSRWGNWCNAYKPEPKNGNARPFPGDGPFIAHIQSHLSEGQEVICKICGKTAKEIIDEKR